MRLRTLPLSFSVIIMGSAFAWELLNFLSKILDPTKYFNWTIFTFLLLTTLFLQILSNLANDYGDAVKGTDNDNRVGPERAIQSGIITAKEMKNGIIITSILSLVSGLYLLYLTFGDILNLKFILFLVLGLLAIAAAIKYTVGKGAYGYRALGDFFVFIFFGLVGVGGSFYLLVKESFHFGILWSAISMGAFCVMVLNLNNMRDRINDAASGKRTMAVILGFKGAKIYHYVLMIIGLSWPIIVMLSVLKSPYVLILLPILIIHLVHLRTVIRIKEPADFDPELKKIALTTFLFSILFWILLVIQ
ncbi:1,4-dihydroxy-2-naphthoate octaprenyltransferase [Crocinitomicaceae bacterium]|jgi:1,4-dihydroxy-2-naphthoate octaprenyltransferase|nr:1,4-dihydroxy-2-naphthoate octaprenyltransferase [Crocinitomicaceae bacterium]